jgi:hypothetical protein
MDFIKKNFLAVCILLSAILLSSALIINGLCSRYVYIDSKTPVFDKLTGSSYITTGKITAKLTIKRLNELVRDTKAGLSGDVE